MGARKGRDRTGRCGSAQPQPGPAVGSACAAAPGNKHGPAEPAAQRCRRPRYGPAGPVAGGGGQRLFAQGSGLGVLERRLAGAGWGRWQCAPMRRGGALRPGVMAGGQRGVVWLRDGAPRDAAVGDSSVLPVRWVGGKEKESCGHRGLAGCFNVGVRRELKLCRRLLWWVFIQKVCQKRFSALHCVAPVSHEHRNPTGQLEVGVRESRPLPAPPGPRPLQFLIRWIPVGFYEQWELRPLEKPSEEGWRWQLHPAWPYRASVSSEMGAVCCMEWP